MKWDILVIGGGHAGIEAALASARMGLNTLMITGLIDRIGAMSCNPAIGGIGKGHLVREIDALGGEMAKAADATGIHFRTLNESRGPAVRAVRCQSDMARYQAYMQNKVLNQPKLSVRQDDAIALLIEDRIVKGVFTRNTGLIEAKKIIITTGTFLGGKLHLGDNITAGGRAGEAPQAGLSLSLAEAGLKLGRLKTGTCPRLDGRSINMDILEEQYPENPAPRFSFENLSPPLPQVSCRITYTNERTHQVILSSINSGKAPIHNGQIKSQGPRYCPSIDDKVVRFFEKSKHLVFLEPHGLDSSEYYPNGLSTSLPPAAQIAFLRTMQGLEDVHVTRFGYAVEYDFVDPTELFATLETKKVKNLYLAGQINGTTGYEEAASQGLMAGINAALACKGEPELILKRSLAYIGVLIDDLVMKGTSEPYRMFTSRAEHRLFLRDDNAYERLMDHGARIKLLDDARYSQMRDMKASVERILKIFGSHILEPSDENNQTLLELGSKPLKEKALLSQIFRRPEIHELKALTLIPKTLLGEDIRAINQAIIEIKYEGYIKRTAELRDKQIALDDANLPEHIFESRSPGLSAEIFEKLQNFRPKTLGQASRIQGMTPAALNILALEILKNRDMA